MFAVWCSCPGFPQTRSIPPKGGFLSAYDIMKMSPLDTPPPGDPLPAASGYSTHEAPVGLHGSRGGSAVSSPGAGTIQRGGGLVVSGSLSIGSTAAGTGIVTAQGDGDRLEAGSPANAAASLIRLLDGDADSSRSKINQLPSCLPPSWEDLLRMIANLPLPSSAIGELAAADKPPQTTIGLMVKPDPENYGLGLVTGCVEGSSSDLSGELRVNDIVLAVDGTPFNHPEGLKKMRGGQAIVSAGTQMRLTLQREGSGVFEVTLVREPYASVQLKRELFELLLHLRESLGLAQNNVSLSPRMGDDPQRRFLCEEVRGKLVELEKTNVSSLRLLRSELQGLQQVMEQMVVYIKRAAAEGDGTIRSLTGRIDHQEEHIAQLSSRVDELVGQSFHDQECETGEHVNHKQMHLLRHECNRLRNSLHNKESELEGLRESFERKLDEQGLRESEEERSDGSPNLHQGQRDQRAQLAFAENVPSSDGSAGEEIDAESELQNIQAQLEQECESNRLAQAALKRDLWVSVIRRWLNNCCRRIITGWRIELSRKQYYRVVCTRLELRFRTRCDRCVTRDGFSSFARALFESKRLRHAGVTAASGWMFLCVRKHLHAWLAYTDWKAYKQRLLSKNSARGIARVFHSWSRIVAHCDAGLDSEMVASILSPTADVVANSPVAAKIMADAKETPEHVAHLKHNAFLASPPAPQPKAALIHTGMQSLRWESNAAMQCNLLPDTLALHPPAPPPSSSPTVTSVTATSSTGSQCDIAKDASGLNPAMVRAPSGGGSSQESSFVFRSTHEQLKREQQECRRLRESLAGKYSQKLALNLRFERIWNVRV